MGKSLCVWQVGAAASLLLLLGCRSPAVPSSRQGQRTAEALAAGELPGPDTRARPLQRASEGYTGFDRNDYPGDTRLPELHRSFAFAGYWLNAPPGESSTSWTGHRKAMRDAGFGFLLLWNGRLEAQIRSAAATPEAQGQQDAAAAVAAARREGFPAGSILFLDQEEGGRLTEAQAAYFFAWTDAVGSAGYRAGAYLSGQPAPDGTRPDGTPQTISTAQNVHDLLARPGSMHAPVALWAYDDSCPPSPGCVVARPALSLVGSAPELVAWQYAQSPRRPAHTASCAATYAADQQCYAGVTHDLLLDLDVARSADPSHGR